MSRWALKALWARCADARAPAQPVRAAQGAAARGPGGAARRKQQMLGARPGERPAARAQQPGHCGRVRGRCPHRAGGLLGAEVPVSVHQTSTCFESHVQDATASMSIHTGVALTGHGGQRASVCVGQGSRIAWASISQPTLPMQSVRYQLVSLNADAAHLRACFHHNDAHRRTEGARARRWRLSCTRSCRRRPSWPLRTSASCARIAACRCACLPARHRCFDSLQNLEHWAILEQTAGSSSHARFSAAAATSCAQYLARLTHTALCSTQELLQYTVQAGDSDREEEDVSDGADWPSTP